LRGLEEVEDEVVGGCWWLDSGYGFILYFSVEQWLWGWFLFYFILVVALGIVLVCNHGFYAALFWWPCFLGGDEGVGCSDNGFGGGLLLWRRFGWWWFLVFGVLVAARVW
jgi:hypothetical protein